MKKHGIANITSAAGLAALGLAMLAPAAQADFVTLRDRNSLARFETDAFQAGMYDWVVDGTDHMFEQWFWYRVGSTGPENSLDTLTQTGIATTDTNPFIDTGKDTLSVLYTGNGFTIDVTYSLRGATAGTGASDVGEQIHITNTGEAALDFHFFQYSDFDLNGTPLDTGLSITGGNTATQTDGLITVGETVVTGTQPPSHYAADTFPTLLNLLNDGSPTTLNDTAGPLANGDFTWGFQWDFLLGVNQSFTISKDKNIAFGTAVPAPGAALLGMLGLGMVRFAKRRLS